MKLSTKLGLVILGIVIAGLGARAARAEDKEARGTATNVTNSSLTLKVGDRDVFFTVDSSTNVEVNGAGHRTRQAGQAGATAPTLPELVKAGGAFLVTYREANGKNQAINVRAISTAGSDAGSTGESTQIATGDVKSVSAAALTIASHGKDVTFAIGNDTKVRYAGAGTATKAAGGRIGFNELVHTGDSVSVTYTDAAGKLSASDVRVVVKAR